MDRCKNCKGKIRDRYRKKIFPLEAHHIIPRRHGGRNTLANGVTLCRFCHNYFDYMYSAEGLDYHEIRKSKTGDEIIQETESLMKRRFYRFLSRVMHYGEEYI